MCVHPPLLKEQAIKFWAYANALPYRERKLISTNNKLGQKTAALLVGLLHNIPGIDACQAGGGYQVQAGVGATQHCQDDAVQ